MQSHPCKGNVVQAVVTKPANSNCTLVTLYVLFESVRFLELADITLAMQLCAVACYTDGRPLYWGG
jgi:hypothetical protein